jgi:hypothetical protein
MTVVVILLLLALIFGVGAVLEGLFWLFVICGVFIVAGAVFAYRVLQGADR